MNNLLQKFQELRTELLNEIYNTVKDNGGVIHLDKPVDFRFDTTDFPADVFGEVIISDLTINKDIVMICYKIPELNESNLYYIDEENSGNSFHTPLYSCSMDELYNIIKIIS